MSGRVAHRWRSMLFVCALASVLALYGAFQPHPWYAYLFLLSIPGCIWMLWCATAPAQPPNTLPGLAQWFSASLPAWALLVIAFASEAAYSIPQRYVIGMTLQLTTWSLLASLALIALACWRDREGSPVPSLSVARVLLVTVLGCALLGKWLAWGLIWGHGQGARMDWVFWPLWPRQLSLLLASGWIACAVLSIRRSHTESQGLPVAFACSLLWTWLFVMGLGMQAEWPGTAYALHAVALLTLAAIPLQANTCARSLHAEPTLVGALCIALAGLAATLELTLSPMAASALWPLALALYLSAHVVLFPALRAWLADWRAKGLWCAFMLAVWLLMLPLAARFEWHHLALVWLAPPLHHVSSAPVAPALAFGALQLALACLLAWHTRHQPAPPGTR